MRKRFGPRSRATPLINSGWARIGNVRREDAARGIVTLEEAARQNPGDVGRQVALFKRYINEIEAEKKRQTEEIKNFKEEDCIK